MRRALPTLVALSMLALPQLSPARAADGNPRGVDVARYQHPNGAVIDWRQVRSAGGSFVYVKATEGTSYVNPYYADDVARARSAGLVAGAYDFVRPALPLSTAIDQANYFLRTIGDQRRPLILPPALDLEVTGGLSRGDLTAWAQLWLDEVRARTGRTPVIYSYPYFLDHAVYGPALHNAKLWIATYRGPVASPIPGEWEDYAIWQNSGSGTYPGVAAAVDTNVFQGTPAELATFADGRQPTTWPSEVPLTPVGVSLSQRSRGTLTLRWLPGNDGGYKTTSWQATLSDGQVVNLPATGTDVVLSGLDPAISYTASLRAVNAKGNGAASGSNAAVPVGPTTLSIVPGTGTAYGPPATATGRLVSFGSGVAGADVQLQQRTGSTWSTVATVQTAADGRWSWTAPVVGNQVLRAVFAGGNGYAPSSTAEVLRAVRPGLSVDAATRIRTGSSWYVAAAVRPTEARIIRLLVLLGGRWTVVSSATTDSRGVVHLTWKGAQAGNRTARLEVGATAQTTGLTQRLDVVVR
jgi:GH25 family lysozyme M1 (1,4-beta-N-acetylmuramidase)